MFVISAFALHIFSTCKFLKRKSFDKVRFGCIFKVLSNVDFTISFSATGQDILWKLENLDMLFIQARSYYKTNDSLNSTIGVFSISGIFNEDGKLM